MPTASALVQRLSRVGSDLPTSLAAQIVALGGEVTPLLLGLVEPHALAGEPAAAESCADCGQQHGEWARFHAIDLLTELRSPAAIQAMLNVLASTSPDDPIHDKVVERLPDFGEAALEPILAALARTTKDTDTGESLACILSTLGVRDGRILQALLDLLSVRPRAAAMYLADYGDESACPALLAIITAFEPDVDDSHARMQRLNLLDAYASLGGELPADVKARIDAWLAG